MKSYTRYQVLWFGHSLGVSVSGLDTLTCTSCCCGKLEPDAAELWGEIDTIVDTQKIMDTISIFDVSGRPGSSSG